MSGKKKVKRTVLAEGEYCTYGDRLAIVVEDGTILGEKVMFSEKLDGKKGRLV